MSFLAKLFNRQPDPKATLVPLWNAVVAIARQPRWYSDCKVADTPEGRFDMLTAVLALVILRMERDDWLRGGSALLTELFVDDMEGQMRQQGIGDPALGKRMGKLMSALGGRIGAYRSTLDDEATLADAIARNMTFADEDGTGDAACVARGLQALAHSLAACSDEAVLAAEFAR